MPNPPIHPHETALAELSRVAEESTRVRAFARVLVNGIRRRLDVVVAEDVSVIREARRDSERARILLEGLARRWGLETGS